MVQRQEEQKHDQEGMKFPVQGNSSRWQMTEIKDKRHGGDRGCVGHHGQGVMVRRDMEVTEVV